MIGSSEWRRHLPAPIDAPSTLRSSPATDGGEDGWPPSLSLDRWPFHAMSTSMLFEFASSIVFLILGVWATAYGYGWVGSRLVGRFVWSATFRPALRWLGPLLVVLCVASLFVILRW